MDDHPACLIRILDREERKYREGEMCKESITERFKCCGKTANLTPRRPVILKVKREPPQNTEREIMKAATETKVTSNGTASKQMADFSTAMIQSTRQQNDILRIFEIYIAEIK